MGSKPIFMADLSAEIMQLVVTFSKVDIYSSLPDMYIQGVSTQTASFILNMVVIPFVIHGCSIYCIIQKWGESDAWF